MTEAQTTGTALEGLHTARGARFGEVAGVRLPLDYGDFAAEVAAMRTGLGVLDLESCGVIVVRGPDAAELLHGLTTNDIKRLREGQVQPNLICATKGKIRYPVDVVRVQAEQFLLVTHPGHLDGVATHLDSYHIREEAEIGRVPLVRVDLIGPGAEAALAALGHATAEPVGRYREGPLLTLGYPLGAVPRVMVLAAAPHAQAWVEALLAAAPEARLVGYEAFDEVRIQAGVPRFGVDFDRDFLPAEAALYDHISFNKGCYVGQEVHARLHHRGHVNRKLTAVAMPPAVAEGLAPDADLYADGKAVGILTSLSRLEVDGERRGIALVRWQYLESGAALAPAADAPATLRMEPVATDLGVART